jgi:hypothetical protein
MPTFEGVIDIDESMTTMNSLKTGARAQHDEQRKASSNGESRIGSMR